jgi:hypothetical protein
MRTWIVLTNRYTHKPGKVHAISDEDPAKSACNKILKSDEPYRGLMPGEYTDEPVTCGGCLKILANQTQSREMDLLPGLVSILPSLELQAKEIGEAWGAKLASSGLRWQPWDPKRADAIALRKVAALHGHPRIQTVLAQICIRAAMQHWQRARAVAPPHVPR